MKARYENKAAEWVRRVVLAVPARGAAVRSGQMYIPKPNGCGNERVCDGVHV